MPVSYRMEFGKHHLTDLKEKLNTKTAAQTQLLSTSDIIFYQKQLKKYSIEYYYTDSDIVYTL